MGQHGFVISLGGLVFYIDVILNALAGGDGADMRSYPPPFGPEEVRWVDYYIATHNHGDHLNMDTILPLAKANPLAKFVVPQPCRRIVTGAGIAENRVSGAKTGEILEILEVGEKSGAGSSQKTVQIIPIPAIHTRFIQDEGEKDEKGDHTCLGFVIRSGGLSIYHSGDTWITPALVDVLKGIGPLNLALLPINGTDWERTANNCIGNVSAMDAVKLAMAVPIDLVIPAHYDIMSGNAENPAHFADYMYHYCPQKRFHISALGEKFVYERD
jgi:L-ascorbate metabolism protein UlaG (beta-lactamase superfamily)